jgi:Fe-S cluster assembly protein SufD
MRGPKDVVPNRSGKQTQQSLDPRFRGDDGTSARASATFDGRGAIAMSPLLDSLAATFEGDGARKAALDAALRDGLPGARSEAWKYTSLRALERRSFAVESTANPIDAAVVAQIPAPRLVLVNGVHAPALSDPGVLVEGVTLEPLAARPTAGNTHDMASLERRVDARDEVFARLNSALARDGVVLRIAAEVRIETPIHFVFVGAPAGSGDLAWHARHLVELGRGAFATVIEHHLAHAPHANLGNALAHVHLAAGARLVHARVQDEAERATLITRTDAVLARDARYARIDLELGAGLLRPKLNMWI